MPARGTRRPSVTPGGVVVGLLVGALLGLVLSFVVTVPTGVIFKLTVGSVPNWLYTAMNVLWVVLGVGIAAAYMASAADPANAPPAAGEPTSSGSGRTGPNYAPGVTPSALGWGSDSVPYPDRFAVNPIDRAELVWVPPGAFRMGSTPEELERLRAENGWARNGWEPEWAVSAPSASCRPVPA